MKTTRIRLIGVVILTVATTLPAGPGQAARLTIGVATPEQRELANWAWSRFTKAGLVLPPIEVDFPGRDLAGCDDARGRAYLDTTPIRIKMCWNDGFILLHEMAHVWESINVSSSKHAPFMDMRPDTLSWASLGVSWPRRGREHAANVIAWGLEEEPRFISQTYPNDPESMMKAFVLLTGRLPLHDGGEGVRTPDRSLFDGDGRSLLEHGR